MTQELKQALTAIAEGYPIKVSLDRYICVENPAYRPDNGADPNLLIDVFEIPQANASERSSKEPLGQESPLSVPVELGARLSEISKLLRERDTMGAQHELTELLKTVSLAAPSVKDMGDRAEALVAARDAARWALCERADGAGKGKCSDDCVCVDEGSKAAEAAVRAYLSALSEASEARGPSKSPKETRDAVIEECAAHLAATAQSVDDSAAECHPGDTKYGVSLSRKAADLRMAAAIVRALKSSPVSAEGGEPHEVTDADRLAADFGFRYPSTHFKGANLFPSARSLDDRKSDDLLKEVLDEASFLVARLEDFEREHGDTNQEAYRHYAGHVAPSAARLERNLSALSKGAEAPGSKDDWQPIETAPRIHDEQLLGWASHKPDGRCYRMIIHWFQPPYTRTGWWVSGSLPVHPRMYAKLPTPPQGLEHGSGQ